MLGLAWLVAVSAAAARADEGTSTPLHERIDRTIEAALSGEPAAPATDAEFLRRAYLDLIGMIPTADEARAFLDDPSPYKRGRLIEELLDRPEYARRLQIVFDVMLMERRPDKYVTAAEWESYLRDAFARNVPFDQLIREILAADGSDPARRGPSKFALDRDGEPNLLVRDIGRMFLGRDFQCAQCHDHPLVGDYKQAHYYGLFAFVSRSSVVQNASGVAALAEKADGDVTFTSVFDKTKAVHKTGPRVLDGAEVAEPPVAKGEEYWVYPADKVRSVPRHSRRSALPGRIASPEVPEFGRNIANRLWALMMGKGLVEPLDMLSEENPPSNPELLDLLTNEFVASGYDVKAFLREVCLTRAYQRSSEPPPGTSEETASPEAFTVAAMKPLSPEQLGWSVMQATGVVASYRGQAEGELFVQDPRFKALAGLDEKRRRLARDLVETRVYERLKGSASPFVQQFGGAAGQPQVDGQSSVHQALFLANGEPVAGWLALPAPYLTGRLTPMTDPSALSDELYLAVLSRRPSAEERADVAKYLEPRGQDRAEAVRELVWALLASAEFRFNH
jgi:hypothetical protein